MTLRHAFLLLTLATAGPGAAPGRADEPADAALRKELLKRIDEDQAARKAWIEWSRTHKPEASKPEPPEVARMTAVDEANTKWLKGVVAARGWPTIRLVGKDGAHAAWLLVQHADRDRPFQRQCLDLMKPLVAQGEVEKRNFAYLTDRVLVADGKKQLYGTQFHTVNGKLEPQPIEDEAKVDERRKEVGLGTLAEYRKQMEKVYGPARK